MTFDIRKLVLVCGLKGETAQHWLYTKADEGWFDAGLPGYFDDARLLFQVGDSIDVHFQVGTVPGSVRLHVTAIDDGVVETLGSKEALEN